MNLQTKSELARLVNRSPSCIDKALKSRKLRQRGEGRRAKIDLDDVDTIQFIHDCKESDAVKAVHQGIAVATDQAAGPAVSPDQADPGQGPEVDLEGLRGVLVANVDQLSRPELERLKTIEQVRAIKQKTDQARLKLIDRDLVARCFAKIYAVDVNEFQTLGANLAPGLASIFGADRPDHILQAEQAITDEVFKVLSHVKRIISDFLKSIETEKLK